MLQPSLSVFFGVLLLLLSSGKFTEAEVIAPLYRAEGDSIVLVLMDIHASIENNSNNNNNNDNNNNNNICTGFSPRAAEIAFTLEWFHQDMVNKGHNHVPGLVIYDVCGDERRTLLVLGAYFSSENRTISSVISYGNLTLQSRISQFLQAFGILHIHINSTAHLSTQEGSAIEIGTVSPWGIRDVLAIIRELGWNNLAIVSSRHPSAIASRDLFLKMSVSYSVCVTSVLAYDQNTTFDNLPSHVILFVSADDSYDDVISSTVFANSFVLVSSDHWEDLSSNFTDKFLYLEHLNTSTDLINFVKEKLVDLSNNSSFLNSYRKWNKCIQDASEITCKGQSISTFLPSRFVGRDIEAALSALKNSQNVLEHLKSNNCTSVELSRCSGLSQFRAVHAGFSKDGTVFTEKYQLLEDVGGEMTSYINRGYITVAEVRNSDIKIVNTITWSRLKNPVSNACLPMPCSNCKFPAKPLTEHENVLMDGEVLLRLRVPLTKKSHLGRSCGEWDNMGVILAEAFKYEISSFAVRFPNILQNIKLGGIVVDSCQGDPVKNEHVFADLEIKDDSMILTHEPFPSVPTFTVSSLGVSFGDPDSSQFVHAAVELLKTLRWTYVHVVYSSGENLLTEFENYLSMTEHEICVSNKIAVGKNMTDMAMKLQKSLKKSNGGAFVLLTNVKDTSVLQNVLMSIHGAFSGANFITFPWNHGIIVHPGTIVISQSSDAVNDVVTAVQNMKPDPSKRDSLLKNFHEDRYKCSLDRHPEMIYPNSCSHSPTFINETISDSLISGVRNAVKIVTSLLDKYYSDACFTRSGKCYNMTNQIDFSKYLTATDKGGSYKELVAGKDIFIYKGENISGTAVKVGFINESGFVSVQANDIKTYSAEFVSYTAVHQCPDWCPECHGCSTASTPITAEHIYQSGDIVLSGMFPVHRSDSAFCGVLALEERGDVMIDAFLFALASAKDRYPYLLPGVRLGSLVLDTCSDANIAVQTLMNFETCRANYQDNGMVAGSQLVTMYLATDSREISSRIQDTVQKYNKSSLTINSEQSSAIDDVTSRFYSTYSEAGLRTIFEILRTTQWSYINIVRSNNSVFDSVVDDFLSKCRFFNVCVHSVSFIDRYSVERIPTLTVTVIFANIEEIEEFFKSLISTPLDHSFIIGEIGPSWTDVSNIVLPNNVRILAIERLGKLNSDLITEFSRGTPSYGSHNPWKKEFELALPGCVPPSCKPSVDLQFASKIVFGVDVILHAFHKRLEENCPTYYGICQQLAKENIQLMPRHFQNISFAYLNSIHIDFPLRNTESWPFAVKNFKGRLLVDVGNYSDGDLSLDPRNIYDTNGHQYREQDSKCFSNCRCIGLNDENNATREDTEDPFAMMELTFYKSSAELNRELWTIIVLIIGVGGAFVALCFVIFVLHKVCAGLLAKRYVGLGILLLVSIIFLFLSVLPFVFTPSSVVCSTRFFIPGFAYTLAYATLMVKIMSLRSYKLIGLGGELSNINQFLTVLFITGVQIAVGVHFWYIEDNKLGFLRTKPNDAQQLEYACVFDRVEFVKYLVFVMFLILLCAIYSIFVRNETKNMGEAKFIMVYSGLCIPIWIAWVVCLIVLSRFWAEVIVCVGILTCATLMTLIVFLPKLHRISRLKYDVKRSGMENGGYKVDNDFMFERPYTLPTSSRSSNKYSVKSNPRFISSFDTSLSY